MMKGKFFWGSIYSIVLVLSVGSMQAADNTQRIKKMAKAGDSSANGTVMSAQEATWVNQVTDVLNGFATSAGSLVFSGTQVKGLRDEAHNLSEDQVRTILSGAYQQFLAMQKQGILGNDLTNKFYTFLMTAMHNPGKFAQSK